MPKKRVYKPIRRRIRGPEIWQKNNVSESAYLPFLDGLRSKLLTAFGFHLCNIYQLGTASCLLPKR
ncbi:hypothetical protein CH371_17535 [Leptospira wolffii]|uniref:Uncharacterized protein n=1 Tax=Leptospira wolffii TaxID=409998 RepID=A0A2M9Z825_9LEPT|nr:hypothetical protein CH371_17535 [Leptospira wolffii]